MERIRRILWVASQLLLGSIALVVFGLVTFMAAVMAPGGEASAQQGLPTYCTLFVGGADPQTPQTVGLSCFGLAIEEMPLHLAVYQCDRQPIVSQDPFEPWSAQCVLVRPAVAPLPTRTATPIPSGQQHQQFYPHIYSANQQLRLERLNSRLAIQPLAKIDRPEHK